MQRRIALGSILASPLLVRAQRTTRLARIGYLSSRRGPNEFEQAFVRGLLERGLVEGTHFVIDYRWADGDAQRMRAMAAELVAATPDVVVAVDGGGALLVRALNPAIPIVQPGMGDPIAQGQTTSLSRPDGNITGTTVFAVELSGKRLEILKETLPGLRFVGMVFNAARTPIPLSVANTLATGDALGLKVLDMRMALPEGIAGGFAAAARQGVQALMILSDTATISHRQPLCDAAKAQRLPAMFSNRTYLKADGFMSYGPDLEGAFHRAGYFVDRILKGARPADLPIEQPTRFELVVNLKIARSLGLTFPRSILARADEAIQ